VPATALTVMEYWLHALQLAPLCQQTAITLMQYRLHAIKLAPLYQQQNYTKLRYSTGYFPYSWHHCTSNSTISDAVQVTCPTVDTTVPATAPAMMQLPKLTSTYWRPCCLLGGRNILYKLLEQQVSESSDIYVCVWFRTNNCYPINETFVFMSSASVGMPRACCIFLTFYCIHFFLYIRVFSYRCY